MLLFECSAGQLYYNCSNLVSKFSIYLPDWNHLIYLGELEEEFVVYLVEQQD